MAIRLMPRQFPSFRRWLIGVHQDLFAIDTRIIRYMDDFPLTDFEKVVLVLEDRRFLHHGGVDIRACFREIFKAVTFRKHGGASTIDMQFVRTVTGYRDLTMKRKIYEIFLSVLIQFRYTKISILRSYLGCAYFGSHLYGVDNAARAIFQRNRFNLTIDQAAELASMLVYPKARNPKPEWSAKIQRRAEYGKRRMLRFKKSLDQIPRRE